MNKNRARALVFAVFCALVVGDSYAGNYYRYTNTLGLTVLNDHVPPQYAAHEYQVLSETGQLLETVPAQSDRPLVLTEEEKRRVKESRREDRYLLASYGSVEEIAQTQKRKLEQLGYEIDLIESKLADTRKQSAEEGARAASYQRAGKKVPKVVITKLSELKEQELKAQVLLVNRHKNIGDTEALYKRYQTRFVELTRSGTSPQAGAEQTPSP